MSKMDATAKKVMALAYFHRYGWIAAILVCVIVWPEQLMYVLSIGCILFSAWSLIGYKCKWKHIYCSVQNAYHQKMTPHYVRWHQVKKSDAYGIPLIFLVLGLVMLIMAIMR